MHRTQPLVTFLIGGYQCNFTAKWLATLPRVWAVPGSNLGQEIGFRNKLLVIFFSRSRQIQLQYLQFDKEFILPHPF
jgi:hypothetical protein